MALEDASSKSTIIFSFVMWFTQILNSLSLLLFLSLSLFLLALNIIQMKEAERKKKKRAAFNFDLCVSYCLFVFFDLTFVIQM
jgi:hypothetical protein